MIFRFIALLCVISSATALAQQSNAELGTEFLATTAKLEGVVQTASGLQYKITEPGNENKPGRRSSVAVHYQGKHINGEVFDSSFGGEPVTFRLDGVIKGWTEGLQYIGEGGQITLLIPSKLAYGRNGSPPAIGRNETLVFIIQLIEVD